MFPTSWHQTHLGTAARFERRSELCALAAARIRGGDPMWWTSVAGPGACCGRTNVCVRPVATCDAKSTGSQSGKCQLEWVLVSVVSADGYTFMSADNMFSQHSTRADQSHDWQAGQALSPAGSVVVRGRCPSGSGGVVRDAPRPCSSNGMIPSLGLVINLHSLPGAVRVVLAVTAVLDKLCYPPPLSRFRGAVQASGHRTPRTRLDEMVQNRVEVQKRVEKPGLRQPIAGYMGHVPGAFPSSPCASGFMPLLFPMECLPVLHAQIYHKGMVALGLHGANWRDLCKQDPKLNPGPRTLKSDDMSRPQTGALQISKRGHASSVQEDPKKVSSVFFLMYVS